MATKNTTYDKYNKVMDELDDYFGMDVRGAVVDDHTDEFFYYNHQTEEVSWGDNKEDVYEMMGYSCSVMSQNTSRDGKYAVFFCNDDEEDCLLVFKCKNEIMDEEFDDWEKNEDS